VVAGTTYWYQVTASNSAGTSAPSAAVSLSVPAPVVVPIAPAAPSATLASGAISVTWGAVSGATGYDVYRATASAGPFTKLTSSSQTGTSYRDASVAAGTTYWYQVTASNSAGTSTPSAAVSISVPVPVVVPAAPAAPTATLASGTVSLLERCVRRDQL
jgi:fibronectin type 3 domain-containing protein